MVDVRQLLSMSVVDIIGLAIVYIIFCLIEFMFIFAPSALIQILIQDFNSACLNSSGDNFQDILDWYQELNNSFQPYCLVYYSYSQFMFIFNIYKSFSFFADDELSLVVSIINLFGKTATFCSIVLNLMTQTEAIDSAYISVKSVTRKIRDNLLKTHEKAQRQNFKYLLEDFKCLEPLNAFGYFEISKNTLTSMLSVR